MATTNIEEREVIYLMPNSQPDVVTGMKVKMIRLAVIKNLENPKSGQFLL